MIVCDKCGVSYSPGCVSCPQCRAATPRESHLAYLAKDAARRVDAGERPDDVRAELVAAGYPEIEADTLVRAAVRKLRRETRRAGVLRFSLGIGMTALGAIAVVGPLLAGSRGIGYLLIGGAILFGSGLLAILSGGVSAVTGRTPPLGPIPSEADAVED